MIISLQVIGLGSIYNNFSDKIKSYYLYLSVLYETSTNPYYDVVVIMDAFDVLLLPKIRKIREVMSQSATPILFCTENGIHPEWACELYMIVTLIVVYVSINELNC